MIQLSLQEPFTNVGEMLQKVTVLTSIWLSSPQLVGSKSRGHSSFLFLSKIFMPLGECCLLFPNGVREGWYIS